MTAIGFPTFGGLRLDQSLDEVGANASIYEHDVDRDGSTGRFRSRDGFQKLNASAATGEYKGLYSHSALRLLAVKRIKATEAYVVAIDKEGTEKTTFKLEEAATGEAPSTFASIGTPTASYTYMRIVNPVFKVLRFDGSEFKGVTATIENVTETGEKEAPKTGKAFPLARHMVGWPDASNVLVFANTPGTTGGPNGAASTNSHVWFSRPGAPEAFEETAFIRLGVGDGEEITGLCVYAAQLYVFKETKFWVVSPPSTNEHGQPVFSFREVSLGQGTHIKQVLTEKLKETSDRICWASQDGVFFCTTDGVYQTTGSQPSKLSMQLKPLEETVPFEGPMAEFLNGSVESFRWPATGICILGRRIFVKRYEFMFVYDINVEVWTCWKMPSVSMAIWTGLTGGGAETVSAFAGAAEDNSGVGTKAWSSPAEAVGTPAAGKFSTISLITPANPTSHYILLKTFGLAVPTGAIVVGIEPTAWRSKNSATSAILDGSVRIVKGGIVQTTVNRASATPWPVTPESGLPTPQAYGGTEDLWGLSWAPSDVNAAGFGVAVSATAPVEGSSLRFFGAQMRVYYLTAESSSGVRPRLFCSQTKTVFWTGPNAEEQATFPGWAWQSGLYDLSSEDEKELVLAKLWGAGTVKVATSKDFRGIEPRHTFELGEDTTQKAQNISDKATLFSHRFEGTGKASIQKFVRYLRTTATSGSQSDPS
jgi:hypothetical protein